MRTALVLVVPVLATSLLAQDASQGPSTTANLNVTAAQAAPVRISIDTRIEATENRKVLVNGQEGGFGGRGAGGGRAGGQGGAGAAPAGPTTVSQQVVFDQAPAGQDWRHYHTLKQTTAMPGAEGARENAIEGGLQGKKVTLKTGEDGQVELWEGEGEDQKAVAGGIGRGVPGRVVLAGLVPQGALGVGQEADLSKTFVEALRGLMHPVTAARPPRGEGAGAGGTGAGGAEGEGGGRGQGGRGQGGRGQGGGQGGNATGGGAGGRFGGGAMGGGAVANVQQLLAGGKLQGKVTGKLAAVEQTGSGQRVAILDVTAVLTGKGSGADLGLRQGAVGGMGGGRGGRGGAQGGGQGPMANAVDKVDATIQLTGKIQVDLQTQQVVAVDLGGDVAMTRATTSTMDRQGEEMKFESNSDLKGKLVLKVRCEAQKE